MTVLTDADLYLRGGESFRASPSAPSTTTRSAVGFRDLGRILEYVPVL
jgi:hypothetical protein